MIIYKYIKEKTMANKKSWLVILVMVLVFGMTVVGCDEIEDLIDLNYKVGGTGPAGGLIFYDKGDNSNGWRYLEAAPEDLPGKLKWSSERFDSDYEFERAVGKGKPNTQAIMAGAAKIGGGFGWAAQACTALTVNGYNDWFLPSRDELHYMYGHLHMQGLGDFKKEDYWSSTFSHLAFSTVVYVWREDFSNGEQHNTSTNTAELRVRPIRQVPGAD
ncbi:MAG: DUF1566 domain-containing protein [Treponema sp.]|nr:DUF1566 domain-containing protein [Treponema sp.]